MSSACHSATAAATWAGSAAVVSMAAEPRARLLPAPTRRTGLQTFDCDEETLTALPGAGGAPLQPTALSGASMAARRARACVSGTGRCKQLLLRWQTAVSLGQLQARTAFHACISGLAPHPAGCRSEARVVGARKQENHGYRLITSLVQSKQSLCATQTFCIPVVAAAQPAASGRM